MCDLLPAVVVVVPKCVCPVSDDVGAFEVGFRMKAGLYKQQALHVEYGTSSVYVLKAKELSWRLYRNMCF